MAFDKWKGLKVGNAQSFQRIVQLLAKDSGEEALISNWINSIAYKPEVSLLTASDVATDDYDGLENNLLVVDQSAKYIDFTQFPYAASWKVELSANFFPAAGANGSTQVVEYDTVTHDTHGFAYGNGAKIPPGMEGYYLVGIHYALYNQSAGPYTTDSYVNQSVWVGTPSALPAIARNFMQFIPDDNTDSPQLWSNVLPYHTASATGVVYLSAGDEIYHYCQDKFPAAKRTIYYYSVSTFLFGAMLGAAIPGEEP